MPPSTTATATSETSIAWQVVQRTGRKLNLQNLRMSVLIFRPRTCCVFVATTGRVGVGSAWLSRESLSRRTAGPNAFSRAGPAVRRRVRHAAGGASGAAGGGARPLHSCMGQLHGARLPDGRAAADELQGFRRVGRHVDDGPRHA
eukprot:scaffold40464_cov63-Phaeocystis_antarctica.AAC.3